MLHFYVKRVTILLKTDGVKYEDVLCKVKEERNILHTVK